MMTNLHTTNVRWTWTDVSMTVVTKTNERETVATWMNLSMTVDINTSLAAPGALAHRLQRRTACQWAPKWPTGLERGPILGYWVLPSTFSK